MLNFKKEFSIASKYKSDRTQSGISLFLVIIIMTILLAIVLGLSTIFLYQLVMFKEIGYSVIAFYAADAGIENGLYLARKTTGGFPGAGVEGRLGNDSSYKVSLITSGKCSSNYVCLKSVGTYKGVKRAIEIAYIATTTTPTPTEQ
jgi:hypothetical protein